MKKIFVGLLIAAAGVAVGYFAAQYEADMDAIEHEFEGVWESLNSLEGIDPEKAGEPYAE